MSVCKCCPCARNQHPHRHARWSAGGYRCQRYFDGLHRRSGRELGGQHQLWVDNIGDSGFLLVRDGVVAFHSPPQQKRFNHPRQIGCAKAGDPLKMTQSFEVDLVPDDVVVAGMTCHFCASLKHKDDGQTKFIKPNSQRQDIIIKYWVSIGSIHREQG